MLAANVERIALPHKSIHHCNYMEVANNNSLSFGDFVLHHKSTEAYAVSSGSCKYCGIVGH